MSSRPFARAWTMWRAAVPVRRAKYSMRSARSAAYAVELTRRAARDLDYLYRRINAAESMAAARWYNGLEKALYSLERFPPLSCRARKQKDQAFIASFAPWQEAAC